LPEFAFDAKTPPMFLVHGDKDPYSPMASVRLYEELHRRKIPAQLFVYANAAHGLGQAVNVCGWQKRLVIWLDSIGF
jgi:dipeptidyl aminopeptidase/acylaminoacyl peptidase